MREGETLSRPSSPRGPSPLSYPPCLATVWEDIYAPYARDRAFCSWLVDLDAKLRAGAGDGGQERSTPDGRLNR